MMQHDFSMHTKTPFFAKVMLFGEYSLLDGSSALTLPYRKRKAWLVSGITGDQNDENILQMRASNHQLLAYVVYLKKMVESGDLAEVIDMDAIEKAVSGGLWLRSDIPTGYGLGSSGALVANIFAHYTSPDWKKKTMDKELAPGILKGVLAVMESYFHGNSSGIDPLCSYMNKAVLVEGKDNIVSVIPMHHFLQSEGSGFFLLDTGQQRKTAPLVSLYHQKKKQDVFRSMLTSRYIPCVNRCIKAVTASATGKLQQHMRELSGMQFTYFTEMIPEHFIPVWEQGFSSGDYSLKLCGAGGGGFLLGFTTNFRQASARLSQFGIIKPEKL